MRLSTALLSLGLAGFASACVSTQRFPSQPARGINPLQALRARYAALEPFDIQRLGMVDYSPKRVCIDVVVEEAEEMAAFRENAPAIFESVARFYARYGVEITVGMIAEPLSIIYSPHDAATARMLVMTPKSFQEKTSLDPKNFAGYAYNFLSLAMIIGSDRDTGYTGEPMALPLDLLVKYWPGNFAHELGHLFGLFHDTITDLDGIESHTDGHINLMSEKEWPESLDDAVLHEEQVAQIHSYLSGGKIYRLVHDEFILSRLRDIDAALRTRRELEQAAANSPR